MAPKNARASGEKCVMMSAYGANGVGARGESRSRTARFALRRRPVRPTASALAGCANVYCGTCRQLSSRRRARSARVSGLSVHPAYTDALAQVSNSRPICQAAVVATDVSPVRAVRASGNHCATSEIDRGAVAPSDGAGSRPLAVRQASVQIGCDARRGDVGVLCPAVGCYAPDGLCQRRIAAANCSGASDGTKWPAPSTMTVS